VRGCETERNTYGRQHRQFGPGAAITQFPDTATVTPVGLLTPPTDTCTGALPAARPLGTSTFNCQTPAMIPGAPPA
jgi:hypothetical protein